MSQDDVPVYYWDACLFLEHLRKEPVSATKRQALIRLLRDNKDKKNVICTSAVVHLEVIPKKLTYQDQVKEKIYQEMFGSKFFYDIPIDAQVIKLARDIKDFYFRDANPITGESHRMMSTGDAIHLATAIISGVTEFHTRDNKKKGGNVPLLDLPKLSPNGKIIGRYDLLIVNPEDAQLDLSGVGDEGSW